MIGRRLNSQRRASKRLPLTSVPALRNQCGLVGLVSGLAPRLRSLLPRNQVDRHADFWCVRDRFEISEAISKAGASAYLPDVLLQVFGFMKVICGCPRTVRVLGGAARGN
jgi:hypothetical protein